jgi:hypothetical protein
VLDRVDDQVTRGRLRELEGMCCPGDLLGGMAAEGEAGAPAAGIGEGHQPQYLGAAARQRETAHSGAVAGLLGARVGDREVPDSAGEAAGAGRAETVGVGLQRAQTEPVRAVDGCRPVGQFEAHPDPRPLTASRARARSPRAVRVRRPRSTRRTPQVTERTESAAETRSTVRRASAACSTPRRREVSRSRPSRRHRSALDTPRTLLSLPSSRSARLSSLSAGARKDAAVGASARAWPGSAPEQLVRGGTRVGGIGSEAAFRLVVQAHPGERRLTGIFPGQAPIFCA